MESSTIRELHRRILSGDVRAVETIAPPVLAEVRRRLRVRFQRVQNDQIDIAATDAFMDYLRAPAQFDDGQRQTLAGFLLHRAYCNVMNLVHSEHRRRLREVAYSKLSTWQCRARSLNVIERKDSLRGVLASIGANVKERRALLRWIDDSSSTSDIAAVLGVADQSSVEQHHEVKRFKDRIKKRAIRARVSI